MSPIEKQITQAIEQQLGDEESVISLDIQIQCLPVYKGEFEFECSESGMSWQGDFTFNSNTDQAEID